MTASDVSTIADDSGQFEATEKISPRLAGAIFATAVLAFLGLLLETVVNVLFPALMDEFSIGMGDVSWMTTGYLLVVSVIMPISGYLQRRFMARTLFVTAACAVTIGAIVAALAPVYSVLLAGRLLQGIGTGIATPLMFTTILMQAPRAKVGQLMGVGALVLGIAPALGPTLGGVVGTFASWRAVFWLTLPLLAVALWVGVRCISQPMPTVREPLSFLQLGLMAVGLIGLVLGVERIGSVVSSDAPWESWGDFAVIALLVVGIAALLTFAVISHRSSTPILHLEVLADRTFAFSLGAFAMLQFACLGLGYILPNYAQLALGMSPMAAGLVGLPGALIGAAFAPLGGMVLDRFGARLPILSGATVAFIGAGGLAIFGTLGQLSVLALCGFHFIFMFGFGLAFANTQTHGMSGISGRLTADATALMNTSQQFCGAMAMTVLSTIIAAGQLGLEPGSAAFRAGTHSGSSTGFIVVAGVALVALACEWMAMNRAKVAAAAE
ncbi:MAG: MFS transporter [Ancrocorticia sp.]|uniref:MFS transporter n=1 Tax=Ancrocorticia sp. TaxID=2593684 RepID=UPI003F93E60E